MTDYIPLDQVPPGSPLGNALLPQLRRTSQMIREYKNGAADQAEEGLSFEREGASALGAGLAGVAAAFEAPDLAVAVVGGGLMAYGLLNDAPLAAAIGRGAVLPVIARMVETQVRRGLESRASASAPAGPRIVPAPAAASK